MLNNKKQSLPFLATTLESIPRDKTLQVAVLDRTAEGLQLAARLANKPFKQVPFVMIGLVYLYEIHIVVLYICGSLCCVCFKLVPHVKVLKKHKADAGGGRGKHKCKRLTALKEKD